MFKMGIDALAGCNFVPLLLSENVSWMRLGDKYKVTSESKKIRRHRSTPKFFLTTRKLAEYYNLTESFVLSEDRE
jgi:hypothetical protein